MVATPKEHRWSSVHAHLGHRADPLLASHPVFDASGCDDLSRAAAYRAWLYESIDASELHAVRQHLKQERALGDPGFQAMVVKALNRPACVRSPGRPPKRLAVEGAT